jgi:hypothetical protein
MGSIRGDVNRLRQDLDGLQPPGGCSRCGGLGPPVGIIECREGGYIPPKQPCLECGRTGAPGQIEDCVYFSPAGFQKEKTVVSVPFNPIDGQPVGRYEDERCVVIVFEPGKPMPE